MNGGGRPARESGLLQRLRRSLHELGPRPGRVLVGYSGGADSLALLSVLGELARLGEVDVQAVHVDHGVRAESRFEAQVAQSVAASLGIPLVVRVLEPARIAAHAGVGREEGLRRERYRAFAQAMDEVGADCLALAHHQRDQAETVLLHLLRGAGLRGAAGMRAYSEIRVPWWDGGSIADAVPVAIWRPLLDEPAELVREYARSLGVPIVEDESNVDESYRRNAIRHSVLPLLEGVAPGATANLARFASLACEDSDELERQAGEWLAGMEFAGELAADDVLALGPALRRRVVQGWIGRFAPVGQEISLNRVEEVIRVARREGGRREIEIGGGVSVLVVGDRLRVRRS